MPPRWVVAGPGFPLLPGVERCAVPSILAPSRLCGNIPTTMLAIVALPASNSDLNVDKSLALVLPDTPGPG